MKRISRIVVLFTVILTITVICSVPAYAVSRFTGSELSKLEYTAAAYQYIDYCIKKDSDFYPYTDDTTVSEMYPICNPDGAVIGYLAEFENGGEIVGSVLLTSLNGEPYKITAGFGAPSILTENRDEIKRKSVDGKIYLVDVFCLAYKNENGNYHTIGWYEVYSYDELKLSYEYLIDTILRSETSWADEINSYGKTDNPDTGLAFQCTVIVLTAVVVGAAKKRQ